MHSIALIYGFKNKKELELKSPLGGHDDMKHILDQRLKIYNG
jgi:hypothetical protein